MLNSTLSSRACYVRLFVWFLYCLITVVIAFPVCKRWRILSQNCRYKIRRVDLRPRTWGDLPSPKILTYKLREMLSKCGSYVRVIDLFSVSDCLDVKTLQVIAQFCPNLTDINISSPLITSRGMNALARKCKTLERLFLHSSSCTCNKLPKPFLLANKRLEYLNVCGDGISIKCLYNLPVDTMRTIILENCGGIKDYDLSTVSQVLGSFRFS